jgi:exodeoxyribonuclease III
VLVATWNVNSLKIRLPRVEAWLDEVRPDVVCLQETKLSDKAFPSLAFSSLGYESVHHGGDGRWNGVAILSRVGLDDPVFGFIPEIAARPVDDEGVAAVLRECRAVSALCGGVRIHSLYVPNGRSLDDPHYVAKLEWLRRLVDQATALDAGDSPTVFAGDFNIAPEDRDVYDPSKFVDSTHTSDAERTLLAELCSIGMEDLFRRHYQQERLYSWWDYRAGDFHQGRGLRIDLLIGTAALRTRWALVDRNARKGKLPSDHAPVLVDLDVA